jgi:predicted metal-dependent enzyme (double-stranded beta helix superfamily)
MSAESYDLEEFVSDLRQITTETQDEKTILSQVRPLAKNVAMNRNWLSQRLYNADPKQGFGVNLLHVESDNTLFIVAVSWLPGRGAPAHDHGTWAVVVGVDGPERNIFWERLDDGSRPGYAELREIGDKIMLEGDVVAMPTGAIHSVLNETSQTTLSFHVYGRHLNHTGRSQFDPERSKHEPFIIETQ